MKAIGKFVLARIEREPKGQIIRPETVQEVYKWAHVVSAGDECPTNEIQVGDRILWKDTATILKGNMVLADSAVFVDKVEGLIAIRYDQIIVRSRREATA